MLVLGSFTMLQNLVQEYFPVRLGALWRSLAPCKRIALGKAPYETVALKRANLAPYKRTALGMAPCQTVAVGMAPYERTALGIRSNRLRTREPRLEEGKLGSVRENRAWNGSVSDCGCWNGTVREDRVWKRANLAPYERIALGISSQGHCVAGLCWSSVLFGSLVSKATGQAGGQATRLF